MERAEVYELIDGERAYQDSLWPDHNGSQSGNPLTVGEFLLLLSEYVAKARAQWAAESKPEQQSMGIVRKIAGIAVNAMEQHGAPPR